MEPARKQNQDIEPDLKPDLRVIDGGGETTPDRPARGNLRAVDDLNQDEQAGNFNGSQGGDTAEDVANSEANTAPTGSWRNGTNPDGTGSSGKSNPGLDTTRAQKALNFAKKRGPLLGILGVLGFTGGMLAIFLGPASILITLQESITANNDSSSTALERRFMKMFGFATGESDPICTNSSKLIKCKMGRLSNKARLQLEKKGITPYYDEGVTNADKKTGYPSKNPKGYTLEENGKKINVGASDLIGYLAKNPKTAAKILGTGGAFNIKMKAWAGKYMAGKFFNKFGLKKDGGSADGKSGRLSPKESLAKLRSKIPGIKKLDSVVAGVKAKIEGHLGKAKKGGVGYMVAVAGCISVKAPGYIAAGVAAIQLAQLLPVSMYSVFSPGSKQKASGVDIANSITEDDSANAANLLTESTPRASDSKLTSAVDSQYVHTALGINTNKTPVSKDFTPGYAMLTSPLVIAANKADKAAAPACNVIMSPAAMYAAFAVDAAITVAASTTFIGGLIKVAGSWVLGEIVGKVASEVGGAAATAAVTELAQNDKVAKAEGEALGDVIGISAIAFFSAGGMSRGLPTLKKSQLVAFDQMRQENESFQRDMDVATLSPFDTSSRYTFAGSIVRNVQKTAIANGLFSSGSILSSVSSLARLPFAALSTNASAAVGYSENTCGYAADFGLATDDPANDPGINVAGMPCTGITPEQASMSTEQAIDLVTGEGWLDESVSIKNDATIQDLIKTGYIKADTPLTDFIETCTSPDTGDYIFNAAGCVTANGSGDTNKISDELGKNGSSCNTVDDETTCASDSTDLNNGGATGVKNPLSLTAIVPFLLDFQSIQSINGEDDGESTTATAADATIDMATLMDDSTQVGCAVSTDEVRNDTGYNNGTAIPIKLCSLPNTYETDPDKGGRAGIVNSRASGAVLAMFDQMKKDLSLDRIALNDSFRTYDEQVRAREKYKSQAALPGYSNHQMGVAFDINMGSENGGNATGYSKNVNTSYPGNRVWEWLQTNAGTYGFKQLPSEGWHWSATGL
ncbi:MAG: M15 family metallopeptidase [Candidatus Microsaccharimonas sp.]